MIMITSADSDTIAQDTERTQRNNRQCHTRSKRRREFETYRDNNIFFARWTHSVSPSFSSALAQ